MGVFPSVSSYLRLIFRLITSYLMEWRENWANEYAYIKPEKMRSMRSESLAQAAN